MAFNCHKSRLSESFLTLILNIPKNKSIFLTIFTKYVIILYIVSM